MLALSYNITISDEELVYLKSLIKARITHSRFVVHISILFIESQSQNRQNGY